MSVRLRPHHILCSIGFEGRGYDAPFTANMTHIVCGQLRGPEGEKTPIKITRQADSICAPCPKRVGAGCVEIDKISALDARHATALSLADNELLNWGACLDRVVSKVRSADLDQLCAGCRWLELGMCKTALDKLIQTRTGSPPGGARIKPEGPMTA